VLAYGTFVPLTKIGCCLILYIAAMKNILSMWSVLRRYNHDQLAVAVRFRVEAG
jgi:hypothetical protein